jgi:hypothetical protein
MIKSRKMGGSNQPRIKYHRSRLQELDCTKDKRGPVERRATSWTAGVRFPAGVSDFYLLNRAQTSFEANLVSIQWLSGPLFPGAKRSEREPDHSSLSSVDVLNNGAIPSLPHMSSWRGVYLIKQRDKFTFTLPKLRMRGVLHPQPYRPQWRSATHHPPSFNYLYIFNNTVTYLGVCVTYRRVLDWSDLLHTYRTCYHTSQTTIWHTVSSLLYHDCWLKRFPLLNSSASRLISWQAGVSKLNWLKRSLSFYNHSARTTQKTQPSYC